MPEMDGYDATKNIRAGKAGIENQDITIVAMTANAMVGDRQKCLDAGMNDYLSKPLEPEDLEKMLVKWLRHGMSPTEESAQQDPGSNVVGLDGTVDTWNQQGALKRLGGREAMLDKLIALYLSDMPNQLAEIHSCYQRNNLEGVCLVAHTIKGVSANLSGTRVQQIAGEIESAAKAADSALIDALLPKLESAYDVLRELLHAYAVSVNAGNVAPPPEVKKGGDPVVVLKTMLARIDAGDFIDEEGLLSLTQLSGTPEVKSAVADIVELLERFELEQAGNSVRALLDKIGEGAPLLPTSESGNLSNAG